MLSLLSRNLHFIVWENFLEIRVYQKWFLGLGLCFLFFAVSFLIGKLFTRRVRFSGISESLVLNYALGSSVFGFLLIFLSFARCLNVFVVSVAALVLAFLSLASWGRSQESRGWTQEFLKSIACNGWLALLFLLNSFSSLVPPFRVDETSYHLPYVRQWVEAGGITVDPTLLYPLNHFNVHLLQSVGLLFGSVTFTHLLSWLSGSMACLTIILFLKRLNVWRPLAYGSGLAFYLSPMIQNYLNVGYVDVPLMFYLAASVYAIYFARQDASTKSFYYSSAVISAFFVGIKMTGILYVPLLIGLAAIGRKRQEVLRFAFLLLAFGLIWNLRNWIISGDPLNPFFNMRFNRPDLFWTKDFYQGILLNVKGNCALTWRFIVSFPSLCFRSTMDGPLREWPLQGFILIFPLTLLLIFWPRFRRGQFDAVLAAGYGCVIWLGTFRLLKYAAFAVLAVVSSGLFLDFVTKRLQSPRVSTAKRRTTAVIALWLLIGPNLITLSFFKNNFSKPIPVNRKSYEAFYSYFGVESMDLIAKLGQIGLQKGTLYANGLLHLKCYYDVAGYPLIGYHVASGLRDDFQECFRKGRVYLFLKAAGVRAALIRTEDLEGLADSDFKNALRCINQDKRLRIAYRDSKFLLIRAAE